MKMKIEYVDVAVAIVALLMLGAFVKLQNIAFMYVFVVLIIAEVVSVFIGKKEAKKSS